MAQSFGAAILVTTLFVGLVAATSHAATPLDTAEQYYDDKKWDEALEAFDAITKQNPHHGFPWFRKARILLIKKRYSEAIEAYLECEQLGFSPKWTAIGLGFSHMGLEEVDEAARWFEKAVTIDPSMIGELPGYSEHLKPFLGPKRYTSIFGPEADESWSRVEGWRADLDFLYKVLKRSHYDFDVKTPQRTWDERVRELREQVPSLDDHEMALELAKIAALAGDGHTHLWPQFSERFSFHVLPLLLYPFEDGVFIRAAAPEYAELAGAKVIRIGAIPIEDLAEGVAEYHGHENPMHNRLLLPFELSTVEVLKQLGATDSADRVEITVEDGSGQQTSAVVESMAFRDPFHPKLSAPGWVSMNQDAEAELPLWLRNPEDVYWFKYLDRERIVYFHYDQIRHKEAESFDAFTDRLFDLVASHPGSAMVIDLRMNDGGSSDIYPPLVRKILAHPEINRKGQLFTIIGRTTYSAAMNLAADLESWTETLFVGEPTGSSPNFIGENKFFELPYSRLRVSVSDRYHQRAGSSTDKRIWIAPDLAAPMTARDFAENRDPAMNAILDYLRALR